MEVRFSVNNLLFVLFTLTVLVGTMFPVVVEALTDRQIAVGRPYFDAMGVPVGLALLLLLGVGPALPWGRITTSELRDRLVPPLVGAALVALVGWILQVRKRPRTGPNHQALLQSGCWSLAASQTLSWPLRQMKTSNGHLLLGLETRRRRTECGDGDRGVMESLGSQSITPRCDAATLPTRPLPKRQRGRLGGVAKGTSFPVGGWPDG